TGDDVAFMHQLARLAQLRDGQRIAARHRRHHHFRIAALQSAVGIYGEDHVAAPHPRGGRNGSRSWREKLVEPRRHEAQRAQHKQGAGQGQNFPEKPHLAFTSKPLPALFLFSSAARTSTRATCVPASTPRIATSSGLRATISTRTRRNPCLPGSRTTGRPSCAKTALAGTLIASGMRS